MSDRTKNAKQVAREKEAARDATREDDNLSRLTKEAAAITASPNKIDPVWSDVVRLLLCRAESGCNPARHSAQYDAIVARLNFLQQEYAYRFPLSADDLHALREESRTTPMRSCVEPSERDWQDRRHDALLRHPFYGLAKGYQNRETISIALPNSAGSIARASLEIAHDELDGAWHFGVSAWGSNHGRGFGPSVWGDGFGSRACALAAAYAELRDVFATDERGAAAIKAIIAHEQAALAKSAPTLFDDYEVWA